MGGGVNQLELLKENGLISFVPTSWFIWTLAYFYIFFFIVYRYIKVSLSVKVILVCGMVLLYTLIAPFLGIPTWRYRSNPGFCVGMIFALLDDNIKRRFVRWQVLLVLCLLCIITRLHIPSFVLICLYPTSLFLLMYMIRGFKENMIVKFLSTISLEMFIIQFIPIYIMMNDLHIKSTWLMVIGVLLLDILLAYLMHLIISGLKSISFAKK